MAMTDAEIQELRELLEWRKRFVPAELLDSEHQVVSIGEAAPFEAGVRLVYDRPNAANVGTQLTQAAFLRRSERLDAIQACRRCGTVWPAIHFHLEIQP